MRQVPLNPAPWCQAPLVVSMLDQSRGLQGHLRSHVGIEEHQ